MEKILSVLSFTNSDGVEVTANIEATAILTISTDGKKQLFNAPKGTRTNVTDITLMDAEQLKNEIRNANSVLYKTAKKQKEDGVDTLPENIAKIAAMQARVDAAKALTVEKFPNEPKTSKANKAQAIFKAIQESNLPEDQKAAALAKLTDLIAVLKVASETGTPAAEVAAAPVVEEVATPVEEVAAPVEEGRRRR